MTAGIFFYVAGGLFGNMWERETRRTEEARLFNRLGMKDESLCWFKRSSKIKWQETDTFWGYDTCS